MATRVSQALPRDELRFEPTPKWVRGEAGGRTVVDSRQAVLVWEPGRVVPGYAFPRDDIAPDALRPREAAPRAEHTAPVAEVWDVVTAGRVAEEGAWSYSDPALEGHVALAWGALERWLEEDEEIVGHPRDPFKRIDVRRSSRRVRVEIDGEVVAESDRARLLFETGLPVRYYLPVEDVRAELLPSDKRTTCAYKGHASYYSVRAGGRVHEDVAWFYPSPLTDALEVRDLVAFFNERADIVVDGEPAGRPQTEWSR